MGGPEMELVPPIRSFDVSTIGLDPEPEMTEEVG